VIRFRALALDYDGTLASHDHLADATIAALERARRSGLRLVLVTGRTFFELARVCRRLDLFDVVVAENGAVLHYPAEDAIRDEGPAPPPRLIAALDRHGRVLAAADSLRSFLGCLAEVDDDVLLQHARRGDLSRWNADVFLERHLASQVRKTERRSERDGPAGLRAALTGLVAGLIGS
jgi:hypothetical protein